MDDFITKWENNVDSLELFMSSLLMLHCLKSTTQGFTEELNSLFLHLCYIDFQGQEPLLGIDYLGSKLEYSWPDVTDEEGILDFLKIIYF